MKTYQYILTVIQEGVGIVTLHRPKSYNALNQELLEELMDALAEFDQQEDIGAMLITGDQKAFAAGADITLMVDSSPDDMGKDPFIPTFSLIRKISKPIIAAVAGYCVGGGFELAMSCDMIIAAENAKFGQPEINLGIIPGAGGTQRLTRAVGKPLAMEMIINNRTLSAEEALNVQVVNHVYPEDTYLEKAVELAQEIAQRAPLAVKAAKKAIDLAFESSLTEGLDLEQAIFYDLFSSEDQEEGMKAFLEKRNPEWKGR
jgi:enoyl-CoA hydratase